jgi:hypothetical protein
MKVWPLHVADQQIPNWMILDVVQSKDCVFPLACSHLDTNIHYLSLFRVLDGRPQATGRSATTIAPEL